MTPFQRGDRDESDRPVPCQYCGAEPGDPCGSDAMLPGCGMQRCDHCQQPAWELHDVGTRARPCEICDDCYDRGEGAPYG